MRFLLRLLLLLVGLLHFGVALGGIIIGPQALYTWVANLINVGGVELDAMSAVFVDGTMRYYAVFVMVFGLICMNVARDFRDNYKLIPVLMSIAIMASCARLWSIYSIGDTSHLSLVVALSEILPAILIMMLYFMVRGKDRY